MRKWMLVPCLAAITVTIAYSVVSRTVVCDVRPAADGGSPTDARDIPVPKQEDWIDYGVVLPSGMTGTWDDGLGMAPAMSSIIIKDNTYFLYYVGFDGVRESDEGERNRSIGVATSPDGVRFEKYASNPILTYQPNQNEEETAGGMAATVDTHGNVVLYWGAADAGSSTSTSVDSDIRLAMSSDGFTFTDRGDVIRHNDRSVWGYGDELYPLGVVHSETTWYLYYIAKGLFGIYWDVGVAWGQTPDSLTHTRCALSRKDGSYIFGGGSIVDLGHDTYVLFLVRNNAAPYMEARTFSVQSPHQLSEPVETYHFDDFGEAAVFLDSDRKTWFMYYLDGSSSDDYFEWTIGLKLAPAGEHDTTPPSAPEMLTAIDTGPSVDITWEAAEDEDTGIARYKIYRNGDTIGSTLDLQYHDNDPVGSAHTFYQISAVNLHGVEGPLSEPMTGSLQDSRSFTPIVRR